MTEDWVPSALNRAKEQYDQQEELMHAHEVLCI